MKHLLPVLLALFVLLAGAFAVAVGVVMLTTGSCSRSARQVGVVLVYQVDQPEEDSQQPVDIDALIAAVDRRINRAPAKTAQVRRLDHPAVGGYGSRTYPPPRGTRRIEIGVFGSDPEKVRRIERMVEHAGTLELRILANRHDHGPLIERAQRENTKVLKDAKGDVQAWWVPVRDGVTLKDQEAGISPTWEIAQRTRQQGRRDVTEVLVVKDPFDVTGAYLESAAADQDVWRRPCVGFVLDAAGARQLGALSSENLPDTLQGFSRRLGIIFDGQLYSAPAIEGPMAKRGQITGSFTRPQVQELVEVLNTGPLPAPIRQVEKRTIGAEQ